MYVNENITGYQSSHEHHKIQLSQLPGPTFTIYANVLQFLWMCLVNHFNLLFNRKQIAFIIKQILKFRDEKYVNQLLH